MPNRNMLDGVLVINEIMDFVKRNKKSCMLVKVDFEKAYDCVSWDFLRFMMERMGFGSKWMGWMESLVLNSTFSILVNGSPTKDFLVSKGIRQGDPLPPFIFLLVVEGLASMMSRASNLGEFSGFQVNDNLHFKILQFIDDTILI